VAAAEAVVVVVVVVLVAAAVKLMFSIMTVQHKVRPLRVACFRPFFHNNQKSFKPVPQIFSFWMNRHSGFVL
jgi:hypothetical protein